MSIEPGQTYRATSGKWEGWTGVAQRPDTPAKNRPYTVQGTGARVIAVGPHPTDESLWTVYPADENDEPVGAPIAIDRAELPLPWPRIGIAGDGPKGAPERRYFDADQLEEVQ